VRSLGYVECAPLPLLEPLVLGLHRPTGRQVLVCSDWDPLGPETEPIETLGFIEPYPVAPRSSPHAEHGAGLVGLTIAVDRACRRHRYAAGGVAKGELVGELGSLLATPHPGAVPAWLVDDRLVTDRHQPPAARPSLAEAAHWTVAPASRRWAGVAGPLPTAKAIARRSVTAALRVASGRRGDSGGPDEEPAGWLHNRPRRATVPLFAAYHPVTGDQLLSRRSDEAKDMGYGPPELLGHLHVRTPVTGTRELRSVPVPWASRFGVRTVRG
jgi:hypothetical protein